MAEKDTLNNELRLQALLGINERVAPNAVPVGQWNELEGLYPARAGLLQRIPGKSQYLKLNSPVWSIHQADDGSGNIFIQTPNALYAYTLDELLSRTYSPTLEYTSLDEEETMSMAVIVQKEANGADGGSIDGYLSGSSSATADTFYGRRLTHNLFNESSTLVSFTASTGGSGAASTAGQFVLAPGTYRIRGFFTFNNDGNVGAYLCGLYNVTDARFEYHRTTGGAGTDPILSTIMRGGGSDNANMVASIDTGFEVTSSNKTFEIRQKIAAAANTVPRDLSCCGKSEAATNANVNGASAPYYYAYITILKTA